MLSLQSFAKIRSIPKGYSLDDAVLDANTLRLKNNLISLNLRFRCIVFLHELEIRTIALLLELPEGTVKSRLHRARKKLKILYLAE
ncbi:sigma factor-like helix-turn-helix DNA-binding protein [Pseudidiomarina terrestris]|uniref:sigma factor-like helix-turn-helix DNA-binding protein n=1 Tax=Pseudidiomarina terrestris TaxID=2820060 RepID=UPI003AB0FC0D